MNFSCDRGELNAAISTVIKATAPKSPMMLLDGILVEAFAEGRVKLTGFNLKEAIFTSIEANVLEIGRIVLNAKMLQSIVNSMPSGDVSFQTDGMNTQIKCGKSKFSIIGMDADEFPALPEVNPTDGISLPCDTLAKMIRQTIFAVSENESRPVYTGELFEIENGNLTIVSCDGYRLGIRTEKVDGVEKDCRFIVPGVALSDLEKLCGDSKDDVSILLGEKHISFSLSETTLISRRLEGEFMNYRTAIPKDFTASVIVDRAELQQTIQRVALVVDDRIKNPLRCSFGDGTIHIACTTPSGRADDLCSIDGNGGGVEIGFNNRYLLDAVKTAAADEITLNIVDSAKPMTITPADGSDSFIYMILPVRLKEG